MQPLPQEVGDGVMVRSLIPHSPALRHWIVKNSRPIVPDASPQMWGASVLLTRFLMLL